MKKQTLAITSNLLQLIKGYSNIYNKSFLILLLLVVVAGCKKVMEEAGTSGVCPIVISASPKDLSEGTILSSKVSATFNEGMNPSTINAKTFTLTQGTTPIAGVITYTGTTATFSPTSNLTPATTYTGTITAGVEDVAGNAMISNYVWSFTTGSGPDIIAPTVTATDPINAATGVALNKNISATFSEAMDSLSATSAFSLTNTTGGGTAVNGAVTYTGTTAVFSPLGNLLPNTTYTATITTIAKDIAGNSLVGSYVWSFTTGILADVIAPTVISTVPANAATGVAFNTKVSATFSEAMDPSTLNATTFTVQQGTTAITGFVTYVGTTATFSPSANLLPNSVYTGTITTGAKDLAGNSLATNYTWSFTTGAAADIVRPTVISTDPANNATNVLIDKKVAANFSEAMDPLSINTATFILKNGAAIVPGTVTYSGIKASFSPVANLNPNTIYTATITAGAKDLAGNTLLSNHVWSFTTQAPVLVTPSIGSASLFGIFGGSAGITNQGLNTVINNGSIGTTGASTLITGFHDGTTGDIYTETPLNVGDVKGRIYTAPPTPGNATSFAVATKGLSDATIAYLSISPASKPGGTDPGAGELGGLTLAPGIYKSASGTFKITNGNLTLDAKGDPNAVWVFQTAAGLTVGVAGPQGARSVNLINGALPQNVFWYVGSAATINGAGGGVMVGTIIASAGVTFSTAGNAVQTVLNGRALSLNASVTLVNTTINVP
ncbi:Ig-like domain-containing protein [Segetibacter aerophilus]|nr:Ig-like domain-containing protein [Segetibacter aerophilus]